MPTELWNDAAGGFHPASAPDFLPEPLLEEVQLRRLKAVVTRAYEKVALFRERFDVARSHAGLDRTRRPDSGRSVDPRWCRSDHP